MNLIGAELQTDADEVFAKVANLKLDLPARLKHKVERLKSRQILLGIRPEHIRLSQGGGLTGIITYAEYLGHEIIYRLDISGQEVLALTERRDLRPGQAVAVTFDSEALHLIPT
jgi:multiple sugar transport system ATP-binding protein